MATQLHNKALLATVRDLLVFSESLGDNQDDEESSEETEISIEPHRKRGSFSSMETGSGSDQETTELQRAAVSAPVTPEGRPASLNVALDSYPSTDSLLDELLCEIRRSVTTSLTSTPTGGLSSDGGEGESAFECRIRRSEAELKTMDISELRGLAASLEQEVECSSSLLVRMLQVKDKRAARVNKLCRRVTATLKDFASKNGLTSKLSFSLSPPAHKEDYQKWLNAWRALSRLPEGIPKAWRKKLWGSVASHGTADVDWQSTLLRVFSEYTMPGDEALGSQIVKDLHRTGNTGFSTEEEHGILKRVLLAYARYNKTTGYCQGFNILAALILKVVDFDEHLALKVMVYLVDHILPENYFAQNLYALSADMATFRELLKFFLPELSAHIDDLQKEASGLIKKAYSSDNPPDIHSIHAYEPPLADVFTMQWFLTIFATALPRKASRRVWDALFLDGSELLVYTAVAILAVMERDLLQTATAADFYSMMAQLGDKLRKAQLLPSSEFMQIVYAVQDNATAPDTRIPPIKKLREKYTYNICPCATPEDDLNSTNPRQNIPCPPPSRGGAFALGSTPSNEITTSKKTPQSSSGGKDKEYVHGQLSSAPPPSVEKERSMDAQIKLLKEHYTQTAKQPCSIRCTMGLTPPKAKAVCPQTKRSVTVSPLTPVYAADVPETILKRSKALSGHSTLDLLSKNKKRVFTIAYSQPQEEEEGDWIHLGAVSSLEEEQHGWYSEPQSYQRLKGWGKAGRDRFSAERENLLRYSSRHLPW